MSSPEPVAGPPLARLLAELQQNLAFNIIEIGAVPIAGEAEPFHCLLEYFPASHIAALEVDPELCNTLNQSAPRGMRYYPCVIGRTEEERTLYETVDPMCSSLYEPNEQLLDLFNNLHIMRLRRKSAVRTTSLDRFVAQNKLGSIDFLKIDIQGAELDALRGGASVLSSVLALVLEAEFVPMYKKQPLLSDLDAYLRERDFMFHKLIAVYGRTMKPLVAYGSINHPVQMLWCDALFTCDFVDLAGLSAEQLLKLAVLMDVYKSRDVALHAVRQYDALCGTKLASSYIERLSQTGDWSIQQVP